MRKPDKVREVYLELRRALGTTVSSRELLSCAAQLVEVADARPHDKGQDSRTGRVAFDELPLDVLFDQWAWRLVSQGFESDDEVVANEHHEILIDRLFARAA